MQNAFDELISILDTAEKTISELGDISIETSETEKQREKKNLQKSEQNIQLWGNYKKCNIHIM